MAKGGTLTLQAYKSEDRVMLEIWDTGIGIPKDLNIEAPFTTTKPGGTGLGLSISHGIVENHGGRIMIDSVHSAYTEVAVELPTV